MANNVDLFEPSEKSDELALLPGPSGVSNAGSEMVSTNYSSDPMSPIPEAPMTSTEDEPDIDNWCDSGNTSECHLWLVLFKLFLVVRKMTSTSSMQCFTDCLDESNMEDPEIHIGSVGDLLKVIFERIFRKIIRLF